MTPIGSEAASRDGSTNPCQRHAGEHRRVHRLIREMALRHAPPPGLFLDVGAGDSDLAELMVAAGYESLRADFTSEQRVGVRADMARLPLADASVRVAAYCASLHYAPDTLSALLEAARVATADGMILVALSPVNETREAAIQGASTTARRMHQDAEATSTLPPYRHFVATELEDALRASGLEVAARVASGGLSSRTRLWRGLKASLRSDHYARFPVLLLRKLPGS